MENNFLTKEEKIDYIYETLKKQEKREFHKQIFRWIFRIFIVLYFLYFYFYGFEKLLEKLDNQISQNLKIELSTKDIFEKIKGDITNINK